MRKDHEYVLRSFYGRVIWRWQEKVQIECNSFLISKKESRDVHTTDQIWILFASANQ